MEFQIEKEFTNTRVPKDNVAEVVTTPTNGNIRISAAGAELLGVKHGDYLGVVAATVEGGEKGIFIHKGYEDKAGNQKGSKLAAPGGKLSGALLCSSAYSWQILGGNEDSLTHYTIDEDGVDNNGVTYFRLRKGEVTAKTPRKTAEAEA